MTITFFSNFFNHHQKPFCDAMRGLIGEGFTFVSTEDIPASFRKAGYEVYSSTPYNLEAFKSKDHYQKAMTLANDSDIVIVGAAPEIFIKNRLKANKIVFRYSERIFKKGWYQKMDPRILLSLFKNHTRYRKKNVYLLCAGGYVFNDFSWVGAYPDKMLKWGYFTEVNTVDIESFLTRKREEPIKLLYVSRLIDWKHPELAVLLAENLKNKGYNFSLEIIGSGDMEADIKSMVADKKLDSHVSLLGNLPNKKVLEKMCMSHIYVFTSDQNEGWGAVANEAMAYGCTLLISNKIGAAPFLIKQKKNGLVFESGNIKDLVQKAEFLINDRSFREELARNAYRTISERWSPEMAAKNFVQVSKSLLYSSSPEIPSFGPCSESGPITKNWHQ